MCTDCNSASFESFYMYNDDRLSCLTPSANMGYISSMCIAPIHISKDSMWILCMNPNLNYGYLLELL